MPRRYHARDSPWEAVTRNFALGMGVWLTANGILLPAIAILALTLSATVWPGLQGILLTAETLGFFIAAMMLLPRIHIGAAATPAPGLQPAPPAA